MLPTPAKFHYVFNLRDLSRIWQGMINTLSEVITEVKTLMGLWKHECCRVIADRYDSCEDLVGGLMNNFVNTIHYFRVFTKVYCKGTVLLNLHERLCIDSIC